MQPFKTLTGVAAPLPMTNVDTDAIIPKQHLKTIKRTGLGRALFEELRYELDGREKPDFVLNKPKYRDASILVAGANFGCGSSREHAPWALLDYGIRCVIAPSFADIFYNNCFNNGILPITLPQEDVDALMREAGEADDPTFTIDLERKVIVRPVGNRELPFDLDDFGRHRLLEGLDQVGLTLQKEAAIKGFEEQQRLSQPWLYPQG
jgi:3-isopropylmalate/(R)-2-methylmalate dehydratase small subunit